MKKWPWIRILGAAASALILAGVAPWIYLLWWENSHHPEPLSEPLLLKRGEYTSPLFITDLNDPYQIVLDWEPFPYETFKLDLDWSIVDEGGRVIQQGTYCAPIGPPANEARLGTYRPKRGLRQRIIVKVNEDVQGPGAKSKIVVSDPEIGLDIAEGYFPLAVQWTVVTAGAGTILLLGLIIRYLVRRAAPRHPIDS